MNFRPKEVEIINPVIVRSLTVQATAGLLLLA